MNRLKMLLSLLFASIIFGMETDNQNVNEKTDGNKEHSDEHFKVSKDEIVQTHEDTEKSDEKEEEIKHLKEQNTNLAAENKLLKENAEAKEKGSKEEKENVSNGEKDKEINKQLEEKINKLAAENKLLKENAEAKEKDSKDLAAENKLLKEKAEAKEKDSKEENENVSNGENDKEINKQLEEKINNLVAENKLLKENAEAKEKDSKDLAAENKLLKEKAEAKEKGSKEENENVSNGEKYKEINKQLEEKINNLVAENKQHEEDKLKTNAASKCRVKHGLVARKSDGNYDCDLPDCSKKSIPKGVIMYGCRPCNFTLCRSCCGLENENDKLEKKTTAIGSWKNATKLFVRELFIYALIAAFLFVFPIAFDWVFAKTFEASLESAGYFKILVVTYLMMTFAAFLSRPILFFSGKFWGKCRQCCGKTRKEKKKND